MLLANYNVFNSSPGRAIGGVTDPTYFFKGGSLNLHYVGDAVISGETDKASFGVGYRPPYSWVLAPKEGGLSSHRQSTIDLDTSGVAAAGLPASGSSTITFTVTGTGGLIVSGSGTATITFSESATLISVASAAGVSTITFTATGSIGANAGISGSSTITISGSTISYAIGYLSGTASNETEFSPDNLARAVWDAIATSYNLPGTMGEKLNAASSAGDPWGTALPGVYPAGSAGDIVGQRLLKLTQFIALK